MDQLFDVSTVLQWVDYLFPSLSEYTKFVAKSLVVIVPLLGIFTNILPAPDHQFPVPELRDLEAELGQSGGVILRIAKWTRTLTVTGNWFLATSLYRGFYTGLVKVSDFLSRRKSNASPPTR